MTDHPDLLQVPVEGGRLAVHDLTPAGTPPDAPALVLVHGITANGLCWRTAAERLVADHGPLRLLAPDVRGRADSRHLPGPYGLAAHARDVLAVAGAVRAGGNGPAPLLVGHSMGAFVSAMAAAVDPGQVGGVVLVDGGVSLPLPPGADPDAALAALLGPAVQRLSMRFDGPENYLAFWAKHPVVGEILSGPAGAVTRDYLLHDLVEGEDGGWRSSCNREAVLADGRDPYVDPAVAQAISSSIGHGVPMELVWAERGLLGQSPGLYDQDRLRDAGLPQELGTTFVPGSDHYDIILTDPGLAAVTAAVGRLLSR